MSYSVSMIAKKVECSIPLSDIAWLKKTFERNLTDGQIDDIRYVVRLVNNIYQNDETYEILEMVKNLKPVDAQQENI